MSGTGGRNGAVGRGLRRGLRSCGFGVVFWSGLGIGFGSAFGAGALQTGNSAAGAAARSAAASVALAAAPGAAPAAAAAGGYRIDGIVTNAETGAPLRGAEVAILVVPEGGGPAAPSVPYRRGGAGSGAAGGFGGGGRRGRAPRTASQSVTTGDDGVFDFENVAPGKYSLEASHRGFLTASYEQHGQYSTAIVTGPGLASEGLALKLSAGAVIAGSVTDSSGDPVEQANVNLYRTDEDGLGSVRTYRGQQADDLGAYEFAHLPPGTYYVSASAGVWYASGNGAAVVGTPQGAAQARPVAEPALNLDVVYPRTYYADASDSSAATPIALHGGEHVHIDLHMHAVPAVHISYSAPANDAGLVHSYSQPPMLTQSVFGESDTGVSGLGRTVSTMDHDRQTVTMSVAPGEYEAEVAGRTVAINATGDVPLDPSTGAPFVEVSGRIAAASGTALPESAYILLQGAGARGAGVINTVVSHDGTFSFERVRPGSYELMVAAEGRSLAILQMAASGARLEGHVLEMGTQPVTLAATVVPAKATVGGFARRVGGEGDTAASGVMIVLVPQHLGDHALYRRDQSDSDGSFFFSDVAAGRYTLVAIEGGWDLDWAQSSVIARYLAGGQPVVVPPTDAVLRLGKPLKTQPR